MHAQVPPERDLHLLAKSWRKALLYSKMRLARVYNWGDYEMERAERDGRIVLEAVCLMIHCSVKCGQHQIPLEFWRVLIDEYGILVYPSAMTEPLDVTELGTDFTFTDLYYGHIVMFGSP